MPFVRITLHAPSLDTAQVARLQRSAKELMASVMRKPIGGIAVLVERATGSWNVAGEEVLTAAHVEATIGRATNTAIEKAQFMTEMMNILRKVLGPDLSEASYIVVNEIDWDLYGRGGLSRAQREQPVRV